MVSERAIRLTAIQWMKSTGKWIGIFLLAVFVSMLIAPPIDGKHWIFILTMFPALIIAIAEGAYAIICEASDNLKQQFIKDCQRRDIQEKIND